jgi:hypothetical protein
MPSPVRAGFVLAEGMDEDDEDDQPKVKRP